MKHRPAILIMKTENIIIEINNLYCSSFYKESIILCGII